MPLYLLHRRTRGIIARKSFFEFVCEKFWISPITLDLALQEGHRKLGMIQNGTKEGLIPADINWKEKQRGDFKLQRAYTISDTLLKALAILLKIVLSRASSYLT